MRMTVVVVKDSNVVGGLPIGRFHGFGSCFKEEEGLYISKKRRDYILVRRGGNNERV